MSRFLRVDDQHAPNPKDEGRCTCGKRWPCIDAYGNVNPPAVLGIDFAEIEARVAACLLPPLAPNDYAAYSYPDHREGRREYRLTVHEIAQQDGFPND